LHRLHVVAKLLVFAFYAVVVFSIQTPPALLCLSLLFAGATLLSKLPLRGAAIVAGMIVLLPLVTVTSTGQTIGGRLVLAAARVVCLTMMVGLFSMTTRLNATLQFLRPSRPIASMLEPVVYLVNTILAVFPSIQYDLRRAMDAEAIRRGKKVRFYSVGSWMTILVVVLVRAMNRAERFTDTVLDRGYVPSRGLRPVGERSLEWQDALLALLSIAPGLAIWIGLT